MPCSFLPASVRNTRPAERWKSAAPTAFSRRPMRWLTAAWVKRNDRAAAVKLPASAAAANVSRCGSVSAIVSLRVAEAAGPKNGRSPIPCGTELLRREEALGRSVRLLAGLAEQDERRAALWRLDLQEDAAGERRLLEGLAGGAGVGDGLAVHLGDEHAAAETAVASHAARLHARHHHAPGSLAVAQVIGHCLGQVGDVDAELVERDGIAFSRRPARRGHLGGAEVVRLRFHGH